MEKDNFTLFTNIDFVTLNGVRTFSHALLLEDAKSWTGQGRMYHLRGFTFHEAIPSFDVVLKSPEYTLAAAQTPHVFIGSDGPRPLASGHIMTFKNGPTVQLVAQDHEQPLCIDNISGNSDESPILRVWAILQPRVRQFWTAPNMPVATWVRR